MNIRRSPQPELSYISARNVRPMTGNFPAEKYKALENIGIHLGSKRVREMAAFAMDSIEPTVTTASINVPVQFLQAWLPGFINVVTQPRNIDDLVGILVAGGWGDAEIIQGILERTGTSQPYADYTEIVGSSWNTNWERRSIIRFEEGIRVGRLEEEQSAKIRVDSGATKRRAAADQLEIRRNEIGFYGYNNGLNRTFGYLNDPNLPSYVAVPDGASSSTLWSTKTYLEIKADILTTIAMLRLNTKGLIDPKKLDITLALPVAAIDYLSVTSNFGNSVQDWLTENYPRIRVVSAPELDAANGGENVLYMYAEILPDGSDDGGRVMIQPIQTKFMVVGVEQRAKHYAESYLNATAGYFLKRPIGVARRTGI